MALLAGLPACTDERQPRIAGAGESPDWLLEARSAVANVEAIRQTHRALSRGRHPSDGGGVLRIVDGPRQVVRGSAARFQLEYEVGPLGLASGGQLELEVSHYWGWSPPQLRDPSLPGYTTVRAAGAGLKLRAHTDGHGRLAIEVAGRGLAPAERIEIAYGAGPALARVDRYVETAPPFHVQVDGDGDGRFAPVAEVPLVEVLAGEAARLLVTLPASARPGESVVLRLAFVDAWRNVAATPAGVVELLEGAAELGLPDRIEAARFRDGAAHLVGRANGIGIHRLRVRAGRLLAESNPLVVGRDEPRLYWGDLHGHSQMSDGTGTPDAYLRYARDFAGLDFSALTDHDHWGNQPLADDPEAWDAIRAATAGFHAPGEFVTLLGYEWTSWIYGHRHVLYFDRAEVGEVFAWSTRATSTPDGLWRALEGTSAITVPHHPAGGPIALDWSFVPPPQREPVVEIASRVGSSEAADAPRVVEDARAGHFARDALERGRRFGFIGSGDRHDGHPGVAHGTPPAGGLAGIYAPELTREALRFALLERRVFATNGPRMVLTASLDGRPMGSVIPPQGPDAAASDAELVVRVVAEGSLSHLDIVRRGEAPRRVPLSGRSASFRERVPRLGPGEYLYLRALQTDGGAAWSSPFFADAP